MKIRCTFALSLALVFAAGVSAQDSKKEQALLQGKWKATKLAIEGMEIPADELAALKITVEGDQFIGQKNGAEPEKNTMKVDPTKKPKSIDLTPQTGPFAGKTMQGIYALEGETLRMCLGLPDTNRPDAFAGGENRVLITLQRVK
jgi:uncharacterized protein (TIGR03067 family)